VVVVCRAKPIGCSSPIALAGSDWKADVMFKGGQAVVKATSGEPPEGDLGAKPLVFQ
jgi:hypothetical protein